MRALVRGRALGWGWMGRPCCGPGVGERRCGFAVGALGTEGLVLWLVRVADVRVLVCIFGC